MRHEFAAILPKLRRYAVALTLNSADADDLLQDTLLRALSRERQYRGENLSAWLCTIMRRIWFNELKKRRRFAANLPVVGLNGQPFAEPDTCLTVNAVDHLLAEQSQLTREIAVLCWVFGCTYQEAATVLDTDLGTVRNRLNRLRVRLVDSLQPAESPEKDDVGKVRAGRAKIDEG